MYMYSYYICMKQIISILGSGNITIIGWSLVMRDLKHFGGSQVDVLLLKKV